MEINVFAFLIYKIDPLISYPVVKSFLFNEQRKKSILIKNLIKNDRVWTQYLRVAEEIASVNFHDVRLLFSLDRKRPQCLLQLLFQFVQGPGPKFQYFPSLKNESEISIPLEFSIKL